MPAEASAEAALGLATAGAAYRERLCATGPCVEKARKLLVYVGFRCVKPLEP